MKSLLPVGFLFFTILLISLPSCTNGEVEKQVSGIDIEELTDPTPDIGTENFRKAWERDFVKMKSEIERARDKWKRNNINSYSFVTAKYIGGVSSPWNRMPVRIKVDDGRPVSTELVNKEDQNTLPGRTDGFEEFDSIDKLFDYMLKELEDGRIVVAVYDKKIGYPILVPISFRLGPHGSRVIKISKLVLAE